MTLRGDRQHGHEHKEMASVLAHYGAPYVPRPSGQHWVSMRCPFHEDRSASAQTDGPGFRCFTCDVFYAAPLQLLILREGMQLDDAHAFYHRLAGTSGVEIPGSTQLQYGSKRVPGGTRHRTSSRRSRQTRRRSGA